MGQFYDEEKIKAMENASGAASPSEQPPTPDAKPSAGHFYDEDKIKAMGGTSGAASPSSKNLANYALIALLVVVGVVMLWWKMTHNPATMIVDINKGSAAQLSYLPGIGEAKAKIIIDHRPYTTIEGLKKVPGIGEKIFEKLKARVKVE